MSKPIHFEIKVDMSKIANIVNEAIAERNRLNEDLNRMIARAKWRFEMKFPRPKARLTLIAGGKN